MATISNKIIINISLLLIIGVNLASSDNSGILARLYKKAVQQDRPLILVLDNAHEKSKNAPKVNKLNHANLESNNDLAPLVYLLQLGQKKKQLAKKLHKHRESQDAYRSDSRNRLQDKRERQLRNRLETDRRDERERREKKRAENDDVILSSPILKKLLDITNTLRQRDCETKDCGEESSVDCGNSDSGSCNEKSMSTKGPGAEPEIDYCKKCR